MSLVVAVGAGTSGVDARQAGWHGEVQALLDARERAVLAGDWDAFAATLDPSADEAFRRGQATLFDGLASVPLESYDLILRTDDLEDLSRAVSDDRDGADEIRLPLIEERLRIRGVDGTDSVNDLWYTFVRRGDQWYLNTDADLADLGLQTQRQLWSFGPVSLTEGPRVVVMSAPGDTERARSLLAITEEAYDRLRAGLDWPAPPKVLVVLPESTGQLEDILQTNFDLSNFVAFATADVDRSEAVGGWKWTAPRVYAQETNLSRHGRDFQVETLHHELVHVVGFDLTGPFIPSWVHEGQADFLATGRPKPTRAGGTDGKLPLDHEFVTGGQNRILLAYRESTSAIAYLAQQSGPDAPKLLFETLGATRVAPGTWEYHLDQALRKVYGKGTDEFEADWDGG